MPDFAIRPEINQFTTCEDPSKLKTVTKKGRLSYLVPEGKEEATDATSKITTKIRVFLFNSKGEKEKFCSLITNNGYFEFKMLKEKGFSPEAKLCFEVYHEMRPYAKDNILSNCTGRQLVHTFERTVSLKKNTKEIKEEFLDFQKDYYDPNLAKPKVLAPDEAQSKDYMDQFTALTLAKLFAQGIKAKEFLEDASPFVKKIFGAIGLTYTAEEVQNKIFSLMHKQPAPIPHTTSNLIRLLLNSVAVVPHKTNKETSTVTWNCSWDYKEKDFIDIKDSLANATINASLDPDGKKIPVFKDIEVKFFPDGSVEKADNTVTSEELEASFKIIDEIEQLQILNELGEIQEIHQFKNQAATLEGMAEFLNKLNEREEIKKFDGLMKLINTLKISIDPRHEHLRRLIFIGLSNSGLKGEAGRHLGRGHMTMGFIEKCFHAAIPEENPMYHLMRPHLKGIAFINFLGRTKQLIAGQGSILEVGPLTPNSLDSETVLGVKEGIKWTQDVKAEILASPEEHYLAHATNEIYPGLVETYKKILRADITVKEGDQEVQKSFWDVVSQPKHWREVWLWSARMKHECPEFEEVIKGVNGPAEGDEARLAKFLAHIQYLIWDHYMAHSSQELLNNILTVSVGLQKKALTEDGKFAVDGNTDPAVVAKQIIVSVFLQFFKTLFVTDPENGAHPLLIDFWKNQMANGSYHNYVGDDPEHPKYAALPLGIVI